MHDEEQGSTPLLFIDKTRFIVSGYVNSQKTSSWCAENARQIQEVTLHEQVQVCHASSANQWGVLVPVFLRPQIHTAVTLILTQFFAHVLQ